MWAPILATSASPTGQRQPRASAGAHARRAGSPDRPVRPQAHQSGAIASSPIRSPEPGSSPC